jgi:predicted small lipoprotein YifL
MKVVRLWLPLCLAGILLGCGQKGPLVQPDTPKHKKAAPSPPAAAAPARPASGAPAPPQGSMPATDAASNPPDKTPKP